MELVNTLGQLMQTVGLNGANSKVTFNVAGYTPGVYFYRYIVAGKLMESGKLVIAR
ncbi:T9SS C-terminal target domain-containing protein [Chitinophaga silvisoli]|uniref:T9SS C-terminal target domain-containing protein n=1 Tax=Chitinophaga silvisoli TaxID=2291814 RepID=A0A3E1PAM2_9BACT|nr:T9SS C-terminal target domain-containing protein [Chitinophaga silvisoli]